MMTTSFNVSRLSENPRLRWALWWAFRQFVTGFVISLIPLQPGLSRSLHLKRPFFAAVTGVICCQKDLGSSLELAWHGSLGLVTGSLLATCALALAGGNMTPAATLACMFVISVGILYPASFPGLFQKFAFATLAMTLHDSIVGDVHSNHAWMLALSGVLGCWVPIFVCFWPLPGVGASLAGSAARRRIRVLKEACVAHQFTMVSAFMSKSRKERIRIMSQGVALNKGFEHQIIKLRALVGPTQWEVALWDFLAYVSLAKHVSRCRSREPYSGAKVLEAMEKDIAMLEQLVLSSSGMELCMGSLKEQSPPQALVQGIRASLLRVSLEAHMAVMGRDKKGCSASLRALDQLTSLNRDRLERVTAQDSGSSWACHSQQELTSLEEYDTCLQHTRREIYYETSQVTDASCVGNVASQAFLLHFRAWAAKVLTSSKDEEECSHRSPTLAPPPPRSNVNLSAVLNLNLKLDHYRFWSAFKIVLAATTACTVYYHLTGSGIVAALAVVFTAAGNDRVSGAFHKCLERVLGVVVGCGAAYMNLSAQSAVQDDLVGRYLNCTMFGIFCALCTLSRTSGNDWAYAALCAAFTAPSMQLEVHMDDFEANNVHALAWTAVEQNLFGLVILVVVDLAFKPMRATNLAVTSLVDGLDDLQQGLYAVWTSFIDDNCSNCRRRAVGEISNLCAAAKKKFNVHRTLAREAAREPKLTGANFHLRVHEELNKESRRLLNLLLLLLECLSMSAITAEEQAAKLVRPLSAPLHILENGMLAVIAEILTGLRSLMEPDATSNESTHKSVKFEAGLEGDEESACLDLSHSKSKRRSLADVSYVLQVSVEPMLRALVDVEDAHRSRFKNLRAQYKLNKSRPQSLEDINLDPAGMGSFKDEASSAGSDRSDEDVGACVVCFVLKRVNRHTGSPGVYISSSGLS